MGAFEAIAFCARSCRNALCIRPEVKKTVGQAINASASVKQNSVQESELQQLEAFFARKANDAMGGKMESQTEKSTDRFYSFFVNM